MKLFTLNESNEVMVNSPWIKLVPEFRALFSTRVKGSKTSYDKDVAGVKRLSYIYFMLDYTSPIADWEDDLREVEALKYTGLTIEDIRVPSMIEALTKYEMLQYEICRPLKTYRAAMRGLEAMDAYLKVVNFDKVDKQGKLLYTPNQFIGNMGLINKAYDELGKLRKRIEEELTQTSSIRGNASMGDREMKFNQRSDMPSETGLHRPAGDGGWNEESDESSQSMNFVDIATLLQTKDRT